MDILTNNLAIFIPYIIIYLLLVIISWKSIFQSQHFKRGNKTIWLCVTLLVHFIGPILYFVIGKDE